jgi:ABC-2 type transport system permease protein
VDAFRLYGRYVAASMRGQMQYPAAFLMQGAGQFVITLVEFLGVYALFRRFGGLVHWRLGEVALFYAVVSIAFALADMSTRGFEVFGEEFVRTGAFDRLLLRPRSAALQLAGYELRLSRLGRLLQGLLVLAIAVRLLHPAWGAAETAVLAFAVMGAVALFFGILVLQATLAFWTVESLEIVNTLTYGGVDAAQFPLDIYARWFRNFLTFVVPLACVIYFPVASVLGHVGRTGAPGWLAPLSPAFGFLFLAASFGVWGFGVRRYTSAGG